MKTYLEIAENVALYRNSYNLVLRGAVQGNQTVADLYANRAAALEFLSTPEKTSEMDRLFADILSELGEFPSMPSALQSIGDRVSPLLKIPEFYKKTLPLRPSQILNNLFQNTTFGQAISSILEKSLFSKGDQRYRSYWQNSSMIVAGDDCPTGGALAAISHELGHCLFETVNAGCIAEQSESFAQAFELVVVESVLGNADDRREWRQYQDDIDKLNYCFLFFELTSDLQSGVEKLGQVRTVLDPELLVLRESLFTKPGYQAVYAAASLNRRRLLNNLKRRRSAC